MGKMLRIAFLVGNLAPYRVPLLRRIARLDGYDVTVLLMSQRERNREWLVTPDGFAARTLPGYGVPLYTSGAGPTTLFVNPTVPFELIRGRYDLVVTLAWTQPHSMLALAICKLERTPILLWEESIPHPPSRLKRLAIPAITRLMRAYTGYLAASSRCIEYLASFGIDRSRIFLFPQVIDNDRFSASLDEPGKRAVRLKLRLPETGTGVLYVGQFIPRKGVLELLEAWRQVVASQRFHDGFLVLVGSGELRDHLSDAIDRFGLRSSVHVTAFKQQDELPLWYGACDIFVLPSRYDTFGVVVNEAMAAGLPVIATEQVGAVGDLVKDEVTGLVVPSNDPHALAAALARMMESAEIRRRMGEVGRHVVLRWNVDLAVAKFAEAASFATTSRKSLAGS